MITLTPEKRVRIPTALRLAVILFAAGLVGCDEPPRSDDLVRFAVSPVRARIHLAWSPWTDLDAGLQRVRAG